MHKFVFRQCDNSKNVSGDQKFQSEGKGLDHLYMLQFSKYQVFAKDVFIMFQVRHQIHSQKNKKYTTGVNILREKIKNKTNKNY